MFEFIKRKIPTLNENEVKIHLLVKKNQSIEKLTFVSFRVACYDQLYGKLIEPSFWPRNVMIGEFVERPRQPKIGDFLDFPELRKRTISNDDDDVMSVSDTDDNDTSNSMFPKGSTHPFARNESNETNKNQIDENENESVNTEGKTSTTIEPLNLSIEHLSAEMNTSFSKNE